MQVLACAIVAPMLYEERDLNHVCVGQMYMRKKNARHVLTEYTFLCTREDLEIP